MEPLQLAKCRCTSAKSDVEERKKEREWNGRFVWHRLERAICTVRQRAPANDLSAGSTSLLNSAQHWMIHGATTPAPLLELMWNASRRRTGVTVSLALTVCPWPYNIPIRSMYSIYEQFGSARKYVSPVTTRVFLPTGLTKPPPSGSGKPDRFDRLPKKTGQIQISNKKRQFNQFLPVSRPVWPVYRSG